MVRFPQWVCSILLHAGVAGVTFYCAQSAPQVEAELAIRSSVSRPMAMDFSREEAPVTFERAHPQETPAPILPPEVEVRIVPEEGEPGEISFPTPVRVERTEPRFDRPLTTLETLPRPFASEGAAEVETDSKAVAIHEAPATYPMIARRRGLEGQVLLEVSILPDGSCGGAAVVESAGLCFFDEAALTAIQTWRFRPATRAGQPIASSQRIRFIFRLQG